ncbi:hypothetical protein QE429_003116 [Bacillus sp. SORGH_AS 510]|uniref:hypothetical protein n=1 Tax=Bacillus sp. SORGH_AS_0510 TaxID=3041771 RepID=UPI0027804901|nr:hypothetical protein [Bacillus sp. SORGH_AS_0510]MDQ1146289.1 hypothetical protein [Bacillus sp. SORGH_AS_0510]
MSLKSALFELKESLTNKELGQSEESFIHELENKNKLSNGSLVFYFSNLMMFHMNENNQNTLDSKKTNRKWTKNEISFMFQYIRDRQDEGALNITEILEETADLLNRGYQSVNYKYYSTLKSHEKVQKANQNGIQFTTINERNVPVISIEKLDDTPQIAQIQNTPSLQDGDLLDILSGLITNVQQLPGLNLHEMLRGLYQLTNMALQNQEALQQMETMKSTINHEKEALREKLVKKEQQLRLEKKRNDDLQLEVSKLAREITAFNKLGDAAKIQNLKSYNQRLNYIIDGFGIVLQVGS